MSEAEIRIIARAEVDQAISEMKKVGTEAERTSQNIQSSARATKSNFMETVGAVQNVTNGFMTLYHTIDNVEKAQLNLSRANLRVSNDLDLVKKAQDNVNGALEKYGDGSEQAIQAVKDLSDVQTKLTLDQENAAQKQNDLNEKIIFGAVTAVPQAIAMINNLKGIYTLLSGAHAVEAAAIGVETAAHGANTAAIVTETTAQIGLNMAQMAGMMGVGLGVGAAAGLIIAAYAQAGEYAKENWGEEQWTQYAKTTSRAGVLTGYGIGGLAGLYGPEKVTVGEYGPEWIIPARRNQPLGLRPEDRAPIPSIYQQPYTTYPGGEGMTGSWMVQVPSGPAPTAPSYSGYQAAMDFLNKQPYQPYVPPKPSAVAPARETDVFYSQPYPSVGTRTPDAFAKNRTAPNIVVHVNFTDIKIDMASLEDMKRTFAFQVAKEVCDAVQEQRGL